MIIKSIPFKNFKEKISITKKYDRKAKISILNNKYVYIELENQNEETNEGFNNTKLDMADLYHKDQ